MSYKGITTTYKLHFQSGIGVPGWDSAQPSSAEEIRNAKILDTQIYGAIEPHGYHGQGIIKNSQFRDTLRGTSSNVYCSGLGAFINHIWVENGGTSIWSGVSTAQDAYLYVQLFEGNRLSNFDSSRQRGYFNTYWNTTGGDVTDSLLVARRLSGTGGFDLNPPGKITFTSLDTHIADNTDPHGSTWIQTNLVSSGIGNVGTTDTVLNGLIRGNVTAKDLNVSGVATFVGKGKFINPITEETMLFEQLNIASGLDIYSESLFRNNIVLNSGVAVDGTSLSGIQWRFTNHTTNFNRPHQETSAQVSGLSITGGTLFGDVYVESGIAIDGRNIRGQFTQLIDHSVLPDSVHTHLLPNFVGFAPGYGNVVTSGIYPGEMSTWYDGTHNYCDWKAGEDNAFSKLVVREVVPDKFKNMSGIEFWNKVDFLSSVSSGLAVGFRFEQEGISGTGAVYGSTNYLSGTAYGSPVTNASGKVGRCLQVNIVPGSDSFESDGNLCAMWHMDEGTGGTIADESSYTNTGTITGASWVTGLYSYGLSFNGSSDYVTVPHDAVFDFGSGSFTICFWIKTTQAGQGTIIEKFGDSNEGGFGIFVVGNKIRFTTRVGTDWDDYDSDASVNDGYWHAVALVKDGSKKYIYIDGALDKSKSYSGSIVSNTGEIGIGWRHSGSDYYYDGIMDDFSIFTRDLSLNEIQAYNSSQYVKLDDSPYLDVTSLSIFAWIKRINTGTYHSIVSRDDNAAGDQYYRLEVREDDKLYFTFWDSDDIIRWKDSDLTIPVNTWTHVGGVYDGNNIHTYVNGTDKTHSEGPINVKTGDEPLYIGKQGFGGGNYFQGYIDELGIWSRPVTTSEIVYLICSGLNYGERSSIDFKLKDTNNNYVTLTGNTNLQNTSWTKNYITYTSGTGSFEEGKRFTVEIDMKPSVSGISTYCGEMLVNYKVG